MISDERPEGGCTQGGASEPLDAAGAAMTRVLPFALVALAAANMDPPAMQGAPAAAVFPGAAAAGGLPRAVGRAILVVVGADVAYIVPASVEAAARWAVAAVRTASVALVDGLVLC